MQVGVVVFGIVVLVSGLFPARFFIFCLLTKYFRWPVFANELCFNSPYLPSDHASSDNRIALSGTVVAWLQQHVSTAAEKGIEAESWGVYAQVGNGTYVFLTDRPTELQADELAERLAVIDAWSTLSEHDKAAKLARVNQERVRSNPDSADEDISAAKEARKSAEYAAIINDADLAAPDRV